MDGGGTHNLNLSLLLSMPINLLGQFIWEGDCCCCCKCAFREEELLSAARPSQKEDICSGGCCSGVGVRQDTCRVLLYKVCVFGDYREEPTGQKSVTKLKN